MVNFVYSVSYASHAVSVFQRDLETGSLTYSSTTTGITNAFSVDVSSDNKSVYIASPGGQLSHSLVPFALATPAVQLSVSQVTAAFIGGASILDPQLQVFDADSTTLSSATVSISQGFVNTDRLSIQTPSSITASYNVSTGVLTLTGSASPAVYQAALRTLSFRSGADPSVPLGGYSTRTITMTTSDGANTSAISSIVVTVGPAVPGSAPVAASIPTLSNWGLILMSSIVAMCGIARLRGRRNSTACITGAPQM